MFGNQRDWDKHLTAICFAFNNCDNESTKFSPHELVFGKILRAPFDVFRISNDSEVDEFQPDQHYENLNKNLSGMRRKAEKFCLDSRKKYAAQYNLRRRDINFKIGSLV